MAYRIEIYRKKIEKSDLLVEITQNAMAREVREEQRVIDQKLFDDLVALGKIKKGCPLDPYNGSVVLGNGVTRPLSSYLSSPARERVEQKLTR